MIYEEMYIMTSHSALHFAKTYFLENMEEGYDVLQIIKEKEIMKAKSTAIHKGNRLLKALNELDIQVTTITFEPYGGICFYLDDISYFLELSNNKENKLAQKLKDKVGRNMYSNVYINAMLSDNWKGQTLEESYGIDMNLLDMFDGTRSIKIHHTPHNYSPTIALKARFRKKNIKHVFEDEKNMKNEVNKFFNKMRLEELKETI